jgi:hypothetical protein
MFALMRRNYALEIGYDGMTQCSRDTDCKVQEEDAQG